MNKQLRCRRTCLLFKNAYVSIELLMLKSIMNSREAEQRDTSKEEGLQILLLYRGQNLGALLYKASRSHQKFNNEY